MIVGPLLLLALAAANAAPIAPPATEAPLAHPASVPLDFLPSLKGDYFRLDSKAVGRSYHIYVRLPEDYAKLPQKSWPVVYVLDGDSLFPMLAPEQLYPSL